MPPKKIVDDRPRIWVDGHQNPPLEPRALALASVHFARESLSGLLSRCAHSAEGLGNEVMAGRWRLPEERLGRTGRYLPSVRAIGRTVRAAAGVLRSAAASVFPAEEALPRSIFTAQVEAPSPAEPRPETAVRMVALSASSPESTADDPDLAAIRALMGGHEAVPAAPPAGQGVTASPAAPRPEAEAGWRRQWLASSLGTALGYGLLVVSVPVGAALAVLAHLNGEDLRRLVDET